MAHFILDVQEKDFYKNIMKSDIFEILSPESKGSTGTPLNKEHSCPGFN